MIFMILILYEGFSTVATIQEMAKKWKEEASIIGLIKNKQY
jgi:hypothetical protein